MTKAIENIQKTFVEDLWEKNPVEIIKKITEICLINKNWGDKLYFVKIDDDGELIFKKTGRCTMFIIVNNFSIRTTESDKNYEHSPMSEVWRNFMFDIYGDSYAMQFISQRNLQLDKFMAQYEDNYNSETRLMLDEMGFNYGQTK